MSIEAGSEIIHSTRRQLRTEEMKEYGHLIPWLSDPSLIPERAVTYDAGLIDNPFLNLGRWMIDQLVKWSRQAHLNLDYAAIFNKNDLSGEERVEVRDLIQNHARRAFTPGVDAMAQIVAAVPRVAVREGVVGSENWLAVASRARNFGALLAREGTNVQALTRLYLASEPMVTARGTFATEQLRLDAETGINTVTPIEDILKVAREMNRDYLPAAVPASCPALYAPLKGELEGKTVYDAMWDTYLDAARRIIFPVLEIDCDSIPPQLPVDDRLRENFQVVTYICLEKEVRSSS